MERTTPIQPASGETSDPSRNGYGPEDILWCLHGYAVHRDREGDGGRVSIEGFECDLDDVAENLRAPLREAFRRWEHANDFVDDGEHLYAWWD